MTETSRRRLVVLTLGIGALVLAWTGLDIWAGRRIDREYARLEKRFGSLDGWSVVAPRVPADDNRARFVRAAADLIVRDRPQQSYAAVSGSFKRFDALPSSARVPDDVRAFLDANADAMRLADEARSRHQSSWGADYGVGGGANAPSLLTIRTLGNALYFAALLEIKVGRSDAAAHRIAAGLAVSASFRQEPVLIGQLIRIGILTQQCEAIQRLIAQSEPSKGSLEELAHLLVENRAPDPIYVGILADLRTDNVLLSKMERGERTERSDDRSSPLWAGRLAWIGRPLLRFGRVRYLRDMEHLLDIEAGPRPRPEVSETSPRFWELRRLTDNYTRGLGRAMDTGDAFNSVLGVTEIGVALRRYRLDRGGYSEELSALVPAYLSRLPIDAVTGRPPIYRRSGTGFTVKAQTIRKESWANAALEWAVGK